MTDPCGQFSKSTGTLRISCLLSLSALILQIVGVTTNYWRVYGNSYAGIWQYCTCADYFLGILYGETGCSCKPYGALPDWQVAVRALETIGTVALSVLSMLHMAQIFFLNSTPIKVLGILFAAASGVIVLVGVAIYGNRVSFKRSSKDDLSYSFFLCTIAGCISFISAVMLLVDKVQTSREAETTNESNQQVKYHQQGYVVNMPQDRQPLA